MSTIPLYEAPIDTPPIYRNTHGDIDRYSNFNPADVLENKNRTVTPDNCHTTVKDILRKEKMDFPEDYKDDSNDVMGLSNKESSVQHEPAYIFPDENVERKRFSGAETSENVANKLVKLNELGKWRSDINENAVHKTEQSSCMIVDKENPAEVENFYDIPETENIYDTPELENLYDIPES